MNWDRLLATLRNFRQQNDIGAPSLDISSIQSELDQATADELLPIYLKYSRRLESPYCMGHQVSAPTDASMAADWVMSVTNNSTAIEEMGPSAIATENLGIQFLLKLVGWEHGGGQFTHGGSLANLTALLAARSQVAPQSWSHGVQDLVLFAPDSSHYCIERAAGIMGMGTQNLWKLKTDERGRILVNEVPALIRAAKAQNKKIVALTANACSTATGQFDDLQQLGQICRDAGIWFHIDGAHGATALLSDRERHHLNGIDLADSLVWDAHKMLQTSALSTAILFKNPEIRHQIFNQDAHYLGKNSSPFASVIECTKPAIGLKLLMNLKTHGRQGLAQYYDEMVDLTKMAYVEVKKSDDFIALGAPQTNIFCFRHRTEDSKILRKKALDAGRFYITQAHVNEIDWLRITVMSPKTRDTHIRELFTHLRSLI